MKFLQWSFISSVMFFLCECSSIPKSVEQWRIRLKYQKVGDETMAYKTYGDKTKPAVVLLHGLPTSSYLYRNIASKIAQQGF